MRGSVYYQATQLIKTIFVEGAKKIDRVNSEHQHFNCIASYKTAETYRRVWENFFNYLKEQWKIKNFELITEEHVEAYIIYKIEYYPSTQYLQKIVSAFAKLEFALNTYSIRKYGKKRRMEYDFSIRKKIYKNAINLELVASNHLNRAYENPELIIENLSKPIYRAAARIQLFGGARFEGIGLILKEQLKGYHYDEIENKECGVITTKEKGGKVGDVFVPIDEYKKLEYYLENITSKFKINYQEYAKEIRETCNELGIKPMGNHGFRWCFAQRRLAAYQKKGYSYDESLQFVSHEMKHNRKEISEHYI